MRKGWKQKKIRENAWGLYFTRWYFIAPSGNKYFFYRSCHFNDVLVPTTYGAYVDPHGKDETQLKRFRESGNKTRHVTVKWFDGTVREYDDVIDDSYDQAIQFIYQVEENGGFEEQDKINKYLDDNKEMNYLFSSSKSYVKYDSMP